MKTLFCVLLLLATGCIPDIDDEDAGAIGVDVLPAQGGGGDIQPATIPITVRVQVEQQRRRSPIIINERDEFADACDCGCGTASCDCGGDGLSRPDTTRQDAEPPQSGAPCQTWHSGGNLYWLADGVQWYLETGGTLGEGQAVQGGRFVMRNGQIVDTSGGRVESAYTSPRLMKQCDEVAGCRLIRIQ